MARRIQIIPKERVYPEGIVLDSSEEWIKEVYEEANAKTAEKYGKDSQAYKTITNGIDIKNVTGSQFFWNTNLGFYLSKERKVCLLNDWEEINDLDESFFGGFYTDSPQNVLRTATLSYNRNKYLLENLVKQVKEMRNKGAKHEFSSENPLIITNPELVKDDNSKNDYGLLIKIGKDTILANDSRFAYSNSGKQVPFGDKTKTVYNKEKDLSGVCLYRDGDLFASSDYLANSVDYGRVVVKEDKR